MNNNEQPNVKVPEEISQAIENYKNQATTWGLEVRRLEMLKSRTEISLSTLQSATADKNAQIVSLDGRIKEMSEKLEAIRNEKTQLEKKIIESNGEMENKEKEIADRIKILSQKESDFKKSEIAFAEKETARKEEIRKFEIEKAELKKKENLIKEFSAKL